METKPDGWYELVVLVTNSENPDEIEIFNCLSLKLNNLKPLISVPNPPTDMIGYLQQ